MTNKTINKKSLEFATLNYKRFDSLALSFEIKMQELMKLTKKFLLLSLAVYGT